MYKDLCLDAVDPLRLGRFWAAVLGLELAATGDEILARGATLLDEHPQWNVLADVEGNEFCVFPRA